LPVQNAYLDGELCGVLPDGRTALNLIQNASDAGEGSLIFFLFDLLFLDDENLMALPLIDRKTGLEAFLVGVSEMLRYNDHQIGQARLSTGWPANMASKASSRSALMAGMNLTGARG
jgi:bifunctional non-homologous end joining protein LigD